jgi:flagellar basal-body rod modification protein FlgD
MSTSLIEPATAPSAGTPTSSRAAADSATIESDYETFLRMLTTQLTNQDPLDPMKTEEFAVQLATFSLVEQQVRTNALLEQMAGDGLTSVAGLIGMEARAPVPARFSGTPVEVFPDVADGADAATLVVRDATGAEVDRRPVAPGTASLDWDGTTANGDRLPDGLYSFEVESRAGGAVLETRPAESWGRIVEVTLQDGAPVAVFEGGDAQSAGDLVAIRAQVSG